MIRYRIRVMSKKLSKYLEPTSGLLPSGRMIRSLMKPDFESLFLQTQDQLKVDLPPIPWTPGYATAALASYSAGES